MTDNIPVTIKSPRPTLMTTASLGRHAECKISSQPMCNHCGLNGDDLLGIEANDDHASRKIQIREGIATADAEHTLDTPISVEIAARYSP